MSKEQKLKFVQDNYFKLTNNKIYEKYDILKPYFEFKKL
jgi:hypothetical protein